MCLTHCLGPFGLWQVEVGIVAVVDCLGSFIAWSLASWLWWLILANEQKNKKKNIPWDMPLEIEFAAQGGIMSSERVIELSGRSCSVFGRLIAQRSWSRSFQWCNTSRWFKFRKKILDWQQWWRWWCLRFTWILFNFLHHIFDSI